MHCIIAYAASERWPLQVLQDLQLPQLHRLLSQLQPLQRDEDDPEPLPPAQMPHERAHARALGWRLDQPLPWAALTPGAADPVHPAVQAWFTPCHWQIGMDQVVMLDPDQLQLSDQESQALLEAMQPFMREDGLQARWHSALQWHVQGPVLADVHAVSPDRVIGQNVKPWITDGHLPPVLRRLQSEMQMLLYQHPVNDARLAHGQLPVNALWVHGAGSPQPVTRPTETVRLCTELRTPALHQDLMAWQAAWQALDETVLGPLAPGIESLTLCSESVAETWTRGAMPWRTRLRRLWRPLNPATALSALITS